jgi:hypothetical protein
LVARIRRLVRIPTSALADLLSDGEAAWGAHEENTARLYEALHYQLQLRWNELTTDDDDRAEIQRERVQAKRAGIRPPRTPLVPPNALRPPKLAQQRVDQYLAEAARYSLAETQKPQMISLAEFERAKGIVTEHQ